MGIILGLNRTWLSGATVAVPKGRDLPFAVYSGRSMRERVRTMFQQTTVGLLDARTTQWSSEAVRGCRGRDDVCEVNGIARWLRGHIVYRGEIPGFDRIQTLQASVQLEGGDCDCLEVAGMTMLTDKGYSVGVRIAMYDQHDGHAWNILKSPRLARPVEQQTVALDLSEDVAVGWQIDLAKVMSVEDYWYEPLPWIAWHRSGQSIESAPMPVAVRPA